MRYVQAPSIRTRRARALPALVIAPRRMLPPEDCSLGTRPRQAINCRALAKRRKSPTSATTVTATTSATPRIPQLAGGEGRHYVGGKQVQRAHALLARQRPPGERTNYVVAATLRCDPLHLSAHPVRRSEDDALVLNRRLPREQAVDAVVVMLVPQLRNRPKPHLMCGARRRFCVGVAVGHDDEAQNADFWRGNVAVQSIRVVPMGAPCPSVRVGVLAHRCRGAETDEIKAMPAGIFDAGRRVSRVPQWRIGLLQRMQFDRDVPAVVMRPGEA